MSKTGGFSRSDAATTVSFQIDKAELDEFEESFKAVSWLEELSGESKRSERMRRALRVVRIIIPVSPKAAEDNGLANIKSLRDSIKEIDVDMLKRRLETLEMLLRLAAALRELEKGRHGGDIEESFALTLANYKATLNKENIREQIKDIGGTLDTISKVLAVSRK